MSQLKPWVCHEARTELMSTIRVPSKREKLSRCYPLASMTNGALRPPMTTSCYSEGLHAGALRSSDHRMGSEHSRAPFHRRSQTSPLADDSLNMSRPATD